MAQTTTITGDDLKILELVKAAKAGDSVAFGILT
jgi:hypothetical protein